MSQEQVKKEILEKYGEISSATNDSSTKKKFLDRTNYKQVYNDFAEGQIDTWYKDPLYGKINQYGMIATTEAKLNILAGIQPLANFALKAFEGFKKDFLSHQRSKKSKYINDIKLVRSWERPDKVQSDYYDSLYNDFYNNTLAKKAVSGDIKNIEDFYRFLKIYLRENDKPFTHPGFMESRFNNPFTSGLVCEIYDGDPTSDTEKTEFYDDPNFPGYQYWAKKHGFKIDPNIPWRMIADIQSENMIEYIMNFYKIELPVTVKKIYAALFTPVASSFSAFERHDGFQKTLLRFYNQFLEEHPEYETKKIFTENAIRKIHVESFKRQPATVDNIIDKYIDTRFLERNISADLNPIKKIAKQIHNYALKQTGDKQKEFLQISINFIEYSIGTITAVRESIDGNSLTTVSISPIFILDLVEDFKSDSVYKELLEKVQVQLTPTTVGALVDIPNPGQ